MFVHKYDSLIIKNPDTAEILQEISSGDLIKLNLGSLFRFTKGDLKFGKIVFEEGNQNNCYVFYNEDNKLSAYDEEEVYVHYVGASIVVLSNENGPEDLLMTLTYHELAATLFGDIFVKDGNNFKVVITETATTAVTQYAADEQEAVKRVETAINNGHLKSLPSEKTVKVECESVCLTCQKTPKTQVKFWDEKVKNWVIAEWYEPKFCPDCGRKLQ